MAQDTEEEQPPDYIHIHQNDFSYRKHKKQKEEDIAICECKYDENQADSACGDSCLNFLTSTECSPGFCPCGVHCKNQRFQKCEYAKTKLFKTEGRGWGLLADEDIKAGQFIIEYCGEVISWKEAKRRSQAYELQGVKDAFMISLNASESIDATKKGSLARFINHSCQPNCETRKWHVLGEVRVGIFARHAIPIGTELAYNYNFEWYGGAKVRCLCGASACSGFLGAKSRGFQEDTYLWEDDDDRYSVEKIPLYDSAEDEPIPLSNLSNSEYDSYERMVNVKVESDDHFLSTNLVVQSLDSVTVGVVSALEENAEGNKERNTSRKYPVGPKSKPKKKLKKYANGRLKNLAQKQLDAKTALLLLPSKEAQEEVLKLEEMKNEATCQLESLYDEIRPAIEEHERDNQDSVATSVAEKWIEASCMRLKAEFELYFSIVKNVTKNSLAKRIEGDNQAQSF